MDRRHSRAAFVHGADVFVILTTQAKRGVVRLVIPFRTQRDCSALPLSTKPPDEVELNAR